MRLKHSGQSKASAKRAVKDIRRATRRHFSNEDKIRIALEGLRSDDSIVGSMSKKQSNQLYGELTAEPSVKLNRMRSQCSKPHAVRFKTTSR
jgi:hypothetical protein